MNIASCRTSNKLPMRNFAFLWLLLAATSAFGAETRAADTNDVHLWMTNVFRPWLTRSYPEITSSFYPEWFHDHPAGLLPGPFTNWLSEVFPDLETEMYPTWLKNPSLERLGTNIPPWWAATRKGKFSVSPASKPLATIIRGPYLQLGTTNSMVVRWRTDLPADSTVSYGSALNRLNRNARSHGISTDHAVQITGLNPATKYYYSFGAVDTPLIVHLTNNIAFISSTNSRIYVNKPGTREQIAVATRDTFIFTFTKKRFRKPVFTVSDPDKSFTVNTTNSSLVVNTPNNSILLSIARNAIVVTSSNQVIWQGSKPGPKSPRDQGENFVVATTNLIRTGGDSNTFFVTNPVIGKPRPTRVWVLGDPGTRKKAERDVRDAYYKWTGDRHTDLWLMLGDNAYTAGKDTEYQGAIFDVYGSMLRKSVLWPCLGNHDAGSANSPIQFGVYYDIFSLPAQAQAGGVMSGSEAYYSFDYANIHIVCLDSSDSSWSASGLMLRWLKADLEANKQDWLVAYCHHPPYTKGSHNSDQDNDSEARMKTIREKVLPMLEEHGLDLMLSGHSHAYERSHLLDGFYGRSTNLNAKIHFKSDKDGRTNGTGAFLKPTRGPAPHEGAVYVVAGSSGQKSGGDLDHPVSILSTNSLGSLVLDFDGRRMDATFINEKAVVLDNFTIIKGGESATKKEQDASKDQKATEEEKPEPDETK
jgi:hypothetical protein